MQDDLERGMPRPPSPAEILRRAEVVRKKRTYRYAYQRPKVWLPPTMHVDQRILDEVEDVNTTW
jgi:hypothetical protein